MASLFLAASAVGNGIERALAGAWLMPPEEGQVIVYTAFSDSTRAFDANRRLIPVPGYKKFELGAYIEYGLTDGITLVASPAYDRIRTPVPGQSYNGHQQFASQWSFQFGGFVTVAGENAGRELGPIAGIWYRF